MDEPRKVGELPSLRSLDTVALADGFAVAGFTCSEDEPDGGCRSPRVEMTVIAEDGSARRPIVVASRSEPLDDGDGLSIVGADGDTVWISSGLGLFEVDESGRALQLPAADGELCALDGVLYSAIDLDGTSTTAPGRPPMSGPEDGSGHRLAVLALKDGEWRQVAGSERAPGSASVEIVSCQPEGIEATDLRTGQLEATWTADATWHPSGPSVPPDSVAPNPGTTRYVQQPDGHVLVRDVDGAYRPSSLTLPNLARAGQPPPMLVADKSASVLVACVTSQLGAAPSAPSSDGQAELVQAASTCGVVSL
jgi:hypothetical protein